MTSIYSIKDLEEKKYGELLLIAKKLGLKCRRLKTEKLIGLILEAQLENDEKEDVVFFSKSCLQDTNKVISEIEPLGRDTSFVSTVFMNSFHAEDSILNVDTLCDAETSSPGKLQSALKQHEQKSEVVRDEDRYVSALGEQEEKHPKNDLFNKKRKKFCSVVFSACEDESSSRLSEANYRDKPVPSETLRHIKGEKRKLSKSDGHETSSDGILPQDCSGTTCTPPRKLRKCSESNANYSDTPDSISQKLRSLATPLATVTSSPLLLAKSEQGRRLSSAKRRSGVVNSNRVVPTFGVPVVVPKMETNKEIQVEESRSDNYDFVEKGEKSSVSKIESSKTGIPRFVAYAQKISKMPDFKRIHEKAFGLMENIDDFLTKKKQLSASVTKNPGFMPAVISTKKMKLNFCETDQHKNDKPSSPAVMKFVGSEEKVKATRSATRSAVKPASRVSGLTAATPATPSRRLMGINRKKNGSTVFPRNENMKPGTPLLRPSMTPASFGSVARRCTTGQGSPRRKAIFNTTTESGQNTILLEVKNNNSDVNKAKMKADITSGTITKSKLKEGDKKLTNFCLGEAPSKLPRFRDINRPINTRKREVLKALASKQPNIGGREERRMRAVEYVKGVRTNKRFQLQMQHRAARP